MVTINNLSGKIYKTTLKKKYTDGASESEKQFQFLFYLKTTTRWDDYSSLSEIRTQPNSLEVDPVYGRLNKKDDSIFTTDDLNFYLWSGRGFGIQAKNTSGKMRMYFELTMTEVKEEDAAQAEQLKNSYPMEINKKTEKFYSDYTVPK